MKQMRIVLLGLGIMLAATAPVCADQYEKPSLSNIVQSLVRFGAVNIYSNNTIDMFARTNECNIFHKYYKDEFTWEQIRGKLRESIRQNVATFPTGYRYDTALKLDRYDFQKKVYPFHLPDGARRANVFAMETHRSDFCTDDDMKGFPKTYKLVLDTPAEIPDLPLNEEEGKVLFERMNKAGNTTHIVFIRFNIRVVYIAALLADDVKLLSEMEQEQAAKVRQRVELNTVTFDSRLDSIEFYEDEARTKLIYIYRP